MLKMLAIKFTVLLLVVSPVCSNLQDMTWIMDMDKISFHQIYDNPELKFVYKVIQKGPVGDFDFLAFNAYSTVEHMGTHMDAPYHFYERGLTMDEVPLSDLIGPLVKINITAKATMSPDALVTLEDVMAWEEKYGAVPDKAFVLMHSGWDQHYGNNTKYLGVREDGTHHSPAFSGEAVEWLVKNRDIAGIGVDTISCDLLKTQVPSYPAHKAVLTKNKLCIENLKDIGKVPDCGARFMMLPIMMKGGTGTQGRAFAEWYEGVGYQTHCNSDLHYLNSYFNTGKAHSVVPSVLLAFTVSLISICHCGIYFRLCDN